MSKFRFLSKHPNMNPGIKSLKKKMKSDSTESSVETSPENQSRRNSGRRNNRTFNLVTKLYAVHRVLVNGEQKSKVGRDLGIPESTLRGWCKNRTKLETQCKMECRMQKNKNGMGNEKSTDSTDNETSVHSPVDSTGQRSGLALSTSPDNVEYAPMNVQTNFEHPQPAQSFADRSLTPLNQINFQTVALDLSLPQRPPRPVTPPPASDQPPTYSGIVSPLTELNALINNPEMNEFFAMLEPVICRDLRLMYFFSRLINLENYEDLRRFGLLYSQFLMRH